MLPRECGNVSSVFGFEVDKLYAHADPGLAVSYTAFDFHGAAIWEGEGELEHRASRKRCNRINKNAFFADVRYTSLRSNARAFILYFQQQFRTP